jgi:ArsR family transcriptional regulator
MFIRRIEAPRVMTSRSPPSLAAPARALSRTEGCGAFAVDEARVRRGRDAVAPEAQLHGIAEVFRALGNPSRLKMLQALVSGELCVCELSEVVGLSLSATSHQLQQLRNLHLVRARSEGKSVHYSSQDTLVTSLIAQCATRDARAEHRR